MQNIGIRKQCRIPAQIEYVEELQKRVVVDPEYTVIYVAYEFWIVGKCRLQLGCPIGNVVFRVVTTPAQV